MSEKSVSPLSQRTAKASLWGLDVSAQKLGLILALVRGRKVSDALTELLFCRKRAAREIRKLVASAAANAEHNYGMNLQHLVVSEIYCGPSLAAKRIMFFAKGKTGRIRKSASSAHVIVKEIEITADHTKDHKKETHHSSREGGR